MTTRKPTARGSELLSDLARTRVVCFTTDIEWAPDWAVRETYAITDRYEVPLTPFVTHHSPYLETRLRTREERFDVGVHPNFLQPSTHGRTMEEIIDHVMALWPEARSYRTHCFYDHTRMSRAFAERGFTYDSNLCLFLQPFLTPFRSGTPLVRFPVFWEDDFHTAHRLGWSIGAIRDALEMPGLKIINVHPLLVALNCPDDQFYERNRALYDVRDEEGWQRYRHAGLGVGTFLVELLEYVRNAGLRIARLHDLYVEAAAQDLTPFDEVSFRAPRRATYGWTPQPVRASSVKRAAARRPKRRARS